MVLIYIGIVIGFLISLIIDYDECKFTIERIKVSNKIDYTFVLFSIFWPAYLFFVILGTLIPFYIKWEERYDLLNKMIKEYSDKKKSNLKNMKEYNREKEHEYIKKSVRTDGEDQILFVDLIDLFDNNKWDITDCKYVYYKKYRIVFKDFEEWSKNIKIAIKKFEFEFSNCYFVYNGGVWFQCDQAHEWFKTIESLEEFKEVLNHV